MSVAVEFLQVSGKGRCETCAKDRRRPPQPREHFFFRDIRRAKHSSNCTLTEMCAKVTPLGPPARPVISPLSTAPIVLLVGPVLSSLRFCASPQTWCRWRRGRGTSIMCGSACEPRRVNVCRENARWLQRACEVPPRPLKC